VRVVVFVVLAIRLAAANPFADGRVSMRLPAGGTLSVVVATANVAPTENVRDFLATDPALAGVKIERLARVHTAVAFIAVPALPRRVDGRLLVAVVDALARDGTFVTIRFYDDSTAHAALAREAASTLDIRIDPSPPPVHVAQPIHPPGWGLRADTLYTVITSPHGECRVIDGELDVRAIAPESSTKVPGDLWGDTVYWSTWVDHEGHHAELIAGAKHIGMIHAVCQATTRAESFQQRKAVEQRFQ